MKKKQIMIQRVKKRSGLENVLVRSRSPKKSIIVFLSKRPGLNLDWCTPLHTLSTNICHAHVVLFLTILYWAKISKLY